MSLFEKVIFCAVGAVLMVFVLWHSARAAIAAAKEHK